MLPAVRTAGRPDRRRPGRLAGLTCLALAALAAGGSAGEARPHFESRVAPILSQRCAACRNPDKRRGGLDVTSRDSLFQKGRVVPGKPGESLLLDMVSGDEAEMPRDARPLSAGQVADLRKWIEAGAEWPEGVTVAAGLWSLRPVERPAAPAVKDPAWVATPIDAFILRRLEEEGLKPAPPADRVTLIRRAPPGPRRSAGRRWPGNGPSSSRRWPNSGPSTRNSPRSS